MVSRKKLSLILIIIGFFLSSVVLAASPEYFKAVRNSTITVTAINGITYDITNSNKSVDYFIPNKSLAEWNAFLAATASYFSDAKVIVK